jgi:hypothetical protein
MVVTGAGQSDARADGASDRWTTQLAGLLLLVAAAAGLLGQGAYYPSVQRPVGRSRRGWWCSKAAGLTELE